MSELGHTRNTQRTPEREEQTLHSLVRELAAVKAELAENRLKTRSLVNSLGEGLIVLDERGHITTINTYALEALGFHESELMNAWFPRVVRAVDRFSQTVDPLDRPLLRALTTGQAVSDYTNYVKSDGTIMPVFVTVSPILVGDKPAGAIEVFRDLTRERELDVAKDEFVALASHQLRGPATGLMMILSMLAKGDFGPLTPVQQKYMDKALRTNENQLQIIEDLLNAARMDAGKLQLELDYTDLVPLVREAIGDYAATILSRRQAVVLDMPDTCRTMADTAKLRMVIDNLISNASKYSRPGTSITISLREEENDVVLSISDQGVGIPPEEVPRLFTKFTRLENELSIAAGGTGLGLFLAKGIIELHDGGIAVRSEPGEGSIFTVRLPNKIGVHT